MTYLKVSIQFNIQLFICESGDMTYNSNPSSCSTVLLTIVH